MATSGFKNIVTSGLVLSLDAGNTKSYPGSGTSWFDLTSNNGLGTLLYGAVYNSAYGGNIVLDGIDDASVQSNVSSAVTANNFTIEVWCRPTATITVYSQSTTGGVISGHRCIIYPDNNSSNSGAGISVGTNGINVLEHWSGNIPTPLTLSTSIPSTTYTNITLIYQSKVPNLYINGVFIKSGLTTGTTLTYSSPYFIGGYAYGNFAGSVALVRHYNRALSASEVLQNYNATKGRFV